MFCNDYVFCGCSLSLLCEQSIQEKNQFPLFSVNGHESTPDYTITVEVVNQIQEPQGSLECVNKRRSYYQGQDEQVFTSYVDGITLENVNRVCKINNTRLLIDLISPLNEAAVFDGLDLPSMLLNKGIGILHCSFVAYQDSALLFAGDKQVGKSTQAALWQTYKNATVVNGDRAGVYDNNGTYFAGGVPYCGTSGICLNRQLPIRAIVCLGKGTENQLEKLSVLDGFKELIGKFSYNHRPVETEQILSLASALAEQVPVYRYTCVKDQSAVEFLEQQLY